MAGCGGDYSDYVLMGYLEIMNASTSGMGVLDSHGLPCAHESQTECVSSQGF